MKRLRCWEGKICVAMLKKRPLAKLSIMSINVWKALSNRADRMAEAAFSTIVSLQDWERERVVLQKEFLRCLGLDPLPRPVRQLETRSYSSHSGEGFRIQNVGFEILPDCWSSAAIYYPEPCKEERAPAVLYVCGHSKIGSWFYQDRAIMWARRGYVCLIVDSIEQNDNPGEHHGLVTGQQDAWLARGYTSAGGEVWNSLRALEILRSDAAVDPERVGVTGISGGGAMSFYVAVLDPKIKALSSLCGISTSKDAIGNQRLYGHCDCMYPHNLFSRDLSEYAALLAPRPALFCFGDSDTLYDPEESSAFVNRTRKIYALYGKEDHCQVLKDPCGHEECPSFTEATQRWFDRHVAGQERPLISRGESELSEQITSVFQGSPPHPNYLSLLPELLSPGGDVRLPQTSEEWTEIKREALASLPPLGLVEPSSMHPANRWRNTTGEIMQSRHQGCIGGVDVVLEVIHRPASRKLLLGIANSGETFQDPLAKLGVIGGSVSLGVYQARLSGANFPAPVSSWPPATEKPIDIRQRMVKAMTLTGDTPVTMFNQDLRVLFDYLAHEEEFSKYEIYLYGRAEAGVAALYCALLDERVAGVVLEDLPASHTEGVPIFASLKSFDLPQAVGLMAPRKISVVAAGHHSWNWPNRVFDRLGCKDQYLMTSNLAEGFQHVLKT